MKLHKIKFVLYVEDFDKMKTFYQEVFGLPEIEGTKGWAELAFDDFVLALDQSERVNIEETHLSFYVSDLKKTIENAQAHGGKLLVEPEFGEHKTIAIAKISDPEGNFFYAAQEFDDESHAQGWSGI